MNNSSAYNNVLLKPAVQTQATQAQAPAVKRNQDDQSYTSFQQSFKDANDHVRNQNDRVTKPAAKKTAPADNRTPAANVEKKPVTSAKQTNESSKSEPVADTEAKVENKDTCAQQNTGDTDSSNREPDSKSSAKKVTVEDEVPVDALAAELINPLTSTPVVPVTETTIPNATFGAIPPVTQVAQATQDSQSTSVTPDSVAVTTNPMTNLTLDGQVGTDQQSPNVDTSSVASTQTATDPLIQQVPVDPLLQQMTDAVVVTPDEAVEQASVILATAGSAVLPKSAINPSAVNATSEDTSNSTVLSTTAALMTGAVSSESSVKAESAAAKTALTPGVAVDADQSQGQQILDTKSSFEKVMQNLVRPDSGSRDENAVIASAAQAAPGNTNTNANPLDSMLRFNDTQTPAARSFVVQAAVPVPVGQPQWSQAVGEKVLWLAAQNVSSAEIHMSPENLGPVQVKVSLNQEQATVNFTSHHPAVREALDQSLGRLREMFSEQGLNLVNVDVSDKSFSRQQGDGQPQKGQAGNNDLNAEEEVQVSASAIVQQRLVDHYA